MSSVCVSCRDTRDPNIITTTDKQKVPTWLKKIKHVRRFKKGVPLKSHISSTIPPLMSLDISNCKTLPHGNSRVPAYMLVWGAEAKRTIDQPVVSAVHAYGAFNNYQVIRLTKAKQYMIHIDCPQAYKARMSQHDKFATYPTHIHFCFSGSDGTWQTTNYTKLVVCNITVQKFMEVHTQCQSCIILNALPAQDYGAYHIPNTYNLPSTTKLRKEKLLDWFQRVITLNNLPRRTRRKLYEIPIIVYCAHETCKAGSRLCRLLLQEGFVDVSHFTGGIKAYRKVSSIVLPAIT